MFFKKYFILFFLFLLPNISSSNFLAEFTCFKDIREYYPQLLEGKLPWQKQKRFFRCVHDTLELFVEKEIFTHDSSRDHFTREEIFRMFRLYFEYDDKTSTHLTNVLFFVKKALVGGSINQLKDKEISDLYLLVYDYQEAYFILHKALPIFHKAFSGDFAVLTPKEKDKALNQVRKTMILLNKAYQSKNISYPINDIYKYSDYLREAQLADEETLPFFQKGFLFLHNLLEGFFYPQKAIKGKTWDKTFQALYKSTELFLYYKTYFNRNMDSSVYAYRIIESLEMFIALLLDGKSKGYPLNNLDQMLSVVVSFFNAQSFPFAEKAFASLQRSQSVPLLTRMLVCFSLVNSNSKRECQSKWGRGVSSPIVTVAFKDSEFAVFSEKIERKQLSQSSVVIESEKLNRLKKWLFHYKQSLANIYSRPVEETARQHSFSHWLDPFFGWEETSSRIKFGSFYTDNQKEKAVQILHYQAFLSLLFSSYLPEGFFSLNSENRLSIPFSTWKNMIEDMTPIFFILNREEGYDSSWRASLLKLFSFADSFLYSSNRDKRLKASELIDVTVHLLEGIKTERVAGDKVFEVCGSNLQIDCIVKTILSDQTILSVYPRFQKYLFETEIHKYTKRIASILEFQGKGEKDTISLLPLFLLIQAIEINYAITDRNKSFQLESEELFLFTKRFEDLVVQSIPQVVNEFQARAYLMYAFKTGYIPFYTGPEWTPLEFTHWYFHPDNQETFKVFPQQFRYLLFDFYQLYQKHEGL